MRYFRFFVISGHLEKEIEDAGFSVYSYSQSRALVGLVAEQSAPTPDAYILDGNIWRSIDASCLGDRTFCLARMPFLSFDEVMNVLMEAKSRDDKLGAAVMMYHSHYAPLFQWYKHLVDT